MEVYYQVVGMSSFGAEVVLLGVLLLLVGLLHKTETFERLVGSRIRGPLNLAYGAYGVPLIMLIMEIQKTRSRGGGIFRFLGIFVILVIVVIIVILALIAFLIYRVLRRRR